MGTARQPRVPFHFDGRDVCRAGRLGFSAKKIWLQFASLLLGYPLYVGLAYGAFLSRGEPLSLIWASYGFFPRLEGRFPWYGQGLFVLGGLLWLGLTLLAATAVAKITYEQLKGDNLYSAGDALRFLRRCWKLVFFVPAVLTVFILLLVAVGLLVGLPGKVPWLGELVLALLVVPLFFVALLTVYVGLVLLTALLLGPAVVATSRSDVVEVLYQLFSIFTRQSWRLIFYQALCLGVAGLGALGFAWLAYQALWLANTTCGLVMGDKLAILLERAFLFLPREGWVEGLGRFLAIYSLPLDLGYPAGRFYPGTIDVAGLILALGLLAIVGMLVASVQSIWATGQALIVVVLRMKKDGENLLAAPQEKSSVTLPTGATSAGPATEPGKGTLSAAASHQDTPQGTG